VKFLKSAAPLAIAFALSMGVSRPATAQNATTTDIQRLEDGLDDASRDIGDLRTRDGGLATRLDAELNDLREETTYLKVKLRKNEAVPRSEYFDMRDRIDTVRSKARGTDRSTAAAPAASSTSREPSTPATTGRSSTTTGRTDVPVGTELDVRLQGSLSSATAVIEDRFEATTVVDLKEGDRVIIPAGSSMRGVVSSVTKTSRLERKGSLTVAFDQVTIGGRSYPIRGTVTQALESEGIRGEAGKIGAGAGVGAIIGGILGGFKGAIAGILIGGGGTIAATEGKDVELPAGSVLRVRLDSGLNLR
jgi:hypothetical protein